MLKYVANLFSSPLSVVNILHNSHLHVRSRLWFSYSSSSLALSSKDLIWVFARSILNFPLRARTLICSSSNNDSIIYVRSTSVLPLSGPPSGCGRSPLLLAILVDFSRYIGNRCLGELTPSDVALDSNI